MSSKSKIKFIILGIFTLFMITLTTPVKAASSEVPVIDGDFSDWKDIQKTTGTWDGNQFAMIVKGDMAYLYISADRPKNATYYNSVALTVNQKTSYLTIKTSQPITANSTNIQTTGDLWNSFANTDYPNSGSITVENDHIIFEGAVPLIQLEATPKDTITMTDSNYGLSNPLTADHLGDPSDQSGSSDSSQSSSDTSNQSNDASDKGSTDHTDTPSYHIIIDGHFDDWNDIPKTDIAEPGDNYNIKRGAMVSDGTDLYIFIQMDYTVNYAYNQLQTDGYELTVGNMTYSIQLVSPGKNNFANTMKQVGDTEQLNFNLYNETTGKNAVLTAGMAGVMPTTKGGTSDAMELKIPLSAIESSNQSGQTITLVNHNLGDQTLTVTGGSTGPWWLAAGGLAIATIGVFKFIPRRRNKAER